MAIFGRKMLAIFHTIGICRVAKSLQVHIRRNNMREPEIDWGEDADEDLLANVSEAEACSLENPESCESCQ